MTTRIAKAGVVQLKDSDFTECGRGMRTDDADVFPHFEST